MIRTLGDQALRQVQEVVRRVLREREGHGTRPTSRVVQTETRWKVKTDAAHAKGASGTVSIYSGPKGSETDTGRDIENVYNTFADLGAGKWAFVEFIDGGWELYVAECD